MDGDGLLIEPERPWRVTPDGVVVRVRVTPRSSREGLGGVEATRDGAAFKARVRAVPEDGKANAAVEKLVAAALGVPKSDAMLQAGAKSRVKLIAVTGDPDTLGAACAALLTGHGTEVET